MIDNFSGVDTVGGGERAIEGMQACSDESFFLKEGQVSNTS